MVTSLRPKSLVSRSRASLSENEVAQRELTVEVDNPDVARVIEQEYRPKQFSRIPEPVLKAAIGFWRIHNVRFTVHPRNSTAGLRRAHRLASKCLWGEHP
jgi:tRNA(Ser,Leu) C12 N-acetylase TAN1